MMDKFLFPGIWLMRQWKLGAKLALTTFLLLTTPFTLLSRYFFALQLSETLLVWISLLSMASACYLLTAFYRRFSQDLQQLTLFADKLAQGDMRSSLHIDSLDEAGTLAASLRLIGATISAMVANVRSNAAFVAHAGKNLLQSNHELSERTEQQASNLEQTAASVEQLSTTVGSNAHTASDASSGATQVRNVADKGAAMMAQAIESVEAIQGSTQRMDEIVGVIDGIAFQTNILALNAAVEAARAGEAGRGFAVVASEVRSLAQRSATSAKEIRQLIGTSSTLVKNSVDHIGIAGDNMTAIVGGIRAMATNMAQISDSSREQSSGLSEITTAMRQLDEITQSNGRMVERAVQQAFDLEERASTLVNTVTQFKLLQGSPEEAIALVNRALAQKQRSTSLESFLHDITHKAQEFYDRDMYVFVLDRDGSYLAFAGNPAKIGTQVQTIPGINGAALLAAIFRQAELEPGWVEYDINNPVSGKVQAKMSYVTQLGNLALGCGVYKNYSAG